MSGLYDRVSTEDQRKKQQKKNRSRVLGVWLSVASIALAVVVAAAAWSAVCSRRNWAFRSDFSDSTYFAYQKDCLRADYQGKSVRVDGEDIYGIMNYVNYAGGPPTPAQRRFTVPEEAPLLYLDYGDGSTLEFWNVPYGDGVGAQLRYTDADGGRYSYVTDRYDLATILVRYITCPDAEPWDK